MLLEPPRHLVDADDALDCRPDIFSHMSDVELLAELRCIRSLAIKRGDSEAAAQAVDLFSTFYEQRVRGPVSAWLWDSTRAFVRQHAVTPVSRPAAVRT